MTKPGYGTINNPLTQYDAFYHKQYCHGFPPIDPGDTCYYRIGTYHCDGTSLWNAWQLEVIDQYDGYLYSDSDDGLYYMYCTLRGEELNRITVKPYNNERVILDGGLVLGGKYLDFIDLEFTKLTIDQYIVSGIPVTSDQAGIIRSFHVDADIEGYFTYYDPWYWDTFEYTRHRFINCDMYNSYGYGIEGAQQIYGCMAWSWGVRSGASSYYGYPYIQSGWGSERTETKHCAMGYGGRGWRTLPTYPVLAHADTTECVFLKTVDLTAFFSCGSGSTMHDMTITGCHAWDEILVVGEILVADGEDFTVEDNVFYSTIYSGRFHQVLTGSIQNNTFVTGVSGGAQTNMMQITPTADEDTVTWDYNTYYNRTGKAACFARYSNLDAKTLAQWQATYGYDNHSTITLDGSSPADDVVVYPNDYASSSKRKGLIVIHNWSKNNSVGVDLSTIDIAEGANYVLRNVQDPYVDVVTAAMPVGKNITVDMQAASHSVAYPSGWTAPSKTFPDFGAFMIEIEV